MSSFEFAFSLFGLVLGLSVTEIIAGFARVLRSRAAIRLGWETPLLGALLVIDLVTFWTNAWNMRELIPPDFLALLVGTVIAAIYFLAASLVFPHDLASWPDLDAYFARHKAQVLIGIVVANWLMAAATAWLMRDFSPEPITIVVHLLYTGLCVALALARRRWQEIALLLVLISLYFIFYFI